MPCPAPFGIGKAGVPKAWEFAWKMGESVADAIAGQGQTITKPADRSRECAAEAGFGKGFLFSPDFSDVCNGKAKDGNRKVGKRN